MTVTSGFSRTELTTLKRNVTIALKEAGFEKGADFFYTNEGEHAHSPQLRGKVEHSALGIVGTVEGRYERTRIERKVKNYTLATALARAGFNVTVEQNHGRDPGNVVVALADNHRGAREAR